VRYNTLGVVGEPGGSGRGECVSSGRGGGVRVTPLDRFWVVVTITVNDPSQFGGARTKPVFAGQAACRPLSVVQNEG